MARFDAAATVSPRKPRLLVALACLWSIGASYLASDESDWVIRNLREPVDSSGITSLTIRNDHGDIRIRSEGDEDFLVAAVVQHQRGVAAPSLAIVPRGDVLTIETSPGGSGDEESDAGAIGSAPQPRIDVTVMLPAGVRVEATTIGGLVEAKGLTTPATLRSVSGDIRVKSKHPVQADTERGSIVAAFQAVDWTGAAASLTSRTGSIEAWLPAGVASVPLRIETGGRITTDYSIEIEAHEDGRTKRARTVTDGTGPRLAIRSINGNVSILRGS